MSLSWDLGDDLVCVDVNKYGINIINNNFYILYNSLVYEVLSYVNKK
jgi:hypothetical protein